VFSSVAGRASAVEDEQTAIALARSKVEELGHESPLSDGVTEGKFDNGFVWRLKVAPYRAEAPTRGST
jgi:hypothetical protein